MSGFIDIHTHLLPGFDDGSKDLEESLKIVEIAASCGFEHLVCTPHQIPGAYQHTEKEIHEATAALQQAVREKGLAMHLFPGAENFMDDVFFDVLEAGRPVAYRPWSMDLLIETPFLRIPEYFEELTFRMMIKKYRPILAHPERYQDYLKKPKRIHEAKEAGYRIQVNLGSFIDLYGKDTRKCAEKMLKMGVVDFVGSDVHTAEHAEILYTEGLARLQKLAGDQTVRRLLIENPTGLLAAPKPKGSA